VALGSAGAAATVSNRAGDLSKTLELAGLGAGD